MKYMLLLIGIFAVILIGIGMRSVSTKLPTTNTIHIVASIYPYGFLAQQIAKNHASVRVMVPPGAEAHDFEPSPKDIAALQEADIVIANGAGMEPWLDEVKKVRDQLKKPTLVMSPEGVEDPHMWLDLNNMVRFAQLIAAELYRIDSAHSSQYDENALLVQSKLKALDEQYSDTLKDCTYRRAIVAHDAFGYLARAYDLDFIPIAGLSHDDEPSAKKIAELIDLARSKQVRVVYFESYADPTLAQTLAQEAGIISLPLDPVETIDDNDREEKNYLTIMELNRLQLKKGLECRQ